MCILSKLFGHAKPDGFAGCFYCGRRTEAKLGLEGPRERVECGWCLAAFEALVACPYCKWEHGVRDKKYYAFKCDGCGEEICSMAYKIRQAQLVALGIFSDE